MCDTYLIFQAWSGAGRSGEGELLEEGGEEEEQLHPCQLFPRAHSLTWDGGPKDRAGIHKPALQEGQIMSKMFMKDIHAL